MLQQRDGGNDCRTLKESRYRKYIVYTMESLLDCRMPRLITNNKKQLF